MRYIHFYGGTGYCGCDFDEYLAVPDDTFNATLDSMAEDFAYDNGESYEHVATGWGNGWENEDEQEDYYQNCWCNWKKFPRKNLKSGLGKSRPVRIFMVLAGPLACAAGRISHATHLVKILT